MKRRLTFKDCMTLYPRRHDTSHVTEFEILKRQKWFAMLEFFLYQIVKLAMWDNISDTGASAITLQCQI
jgi:hypothetical protein